MVKFCTKLTFEVYRLMRKKLLLLFIGLASCVAISAMATTYTSLKLTLNKEENPFDLKVQAGPHTKVNEDTGTVVIVSNHNLEHRARSTLTVVNAQGKAICRYRISLMEGEEMGGSNHNVLHVEMNPLGMCLAKGDNGVWSTGTVSTKADAEGKSHIDLRAYES